MFLNLGFLLKVLTSNKNTCFILILLLWVLLLRALYKQPHSQTYHVARGLIWYPKFGPPSKKVERPWSKHFSIHCQLFAFFISFGLRNHFPLFYFSFQFLISSSQGWSFWFSCTTRKCFTSGCRSYFKTHYFVTGKY